MALPDITALTLEELVTLDEQVRARLDVLKNQAERAAAAAELESLVAQAARSAKARGLDNAAVNAAVEAAITRA